MSNKIDIAGLKRSVDIVEVINRFLTLKHEAPHDTCPCPFHKEKTSSFKVTRSKQIFKCFGCGEAGDVFDFLMKYKGWDLATSIDYLHDPNNTAAIQHGNPKQNTSVKKESAPEWKQVIPAIRMDDMFKFPYKENDVWKYRYPNAHWDYENAAGELIGCVCRFDLPNGKDVLPLIYVTNGKTTKWKYQGFDKPRLLFGLQRLFANPTLPVLIVEGEKTAIAAQLLFPNTVVVTWMGGVQGVKYADWSVLQDRNVIAAPDNDTPGFKAMHEIRDILEEIVARFQWMLNPSDADKGWDIADADWDIAAAKKYAATNIIDYPGKDFEYESKGAVNGLVWNINVIEKEPSAKEKKEAEKKQTAENKKKIAEEKKSEKEKKKNPLPPVDGDPDGFSLKGTEYFRILGAQKEGNGMVYYFYSFSTKTVIGLSPSSMTKNNLMQLAPLAWWKNTFPDDKNGFSVDKAANYLINYSGNVRTYTDKHLRGRGAWMDGKNVVIHAGDKLIINGKETKLSEYQSKYIYEIGEELGFSVAGPIKNVDAVKLVDLLSLLNWDDSMNAWLFAGWCIVAPICGVLAWRPHIWLTGAAGTGKTWVFKNLLRELLGECALSVQGETSEAGLRQTLGHDALPVVFDEAEGEDRKSQERMQSVLGLMRASSSNDGGLMAKGSAGGSAKTYKIRSCFAFASIRPQVVHQSDRTRIKTLGLLKDLRPDAVERWETFKSKYNALITDDFCKGIRARTISLIPVILQNIKTFSHAATTVIGESRSGDQVGVLVAGAYSLFSDKVISYSDAVKWIAAKDWTEEKGLGNTRDEVRLLSYLLEYVVRIETKSATVERTVGELVLICMMLRLEEWSISIEQANDRLKRLGMKVKDGYLYISNSDANIMKVLKDSNWPTNHNKILMRIGGAVSTDNTERFASGVGTRAVMIPKDAMFKGMKPETLPMPMTPLEAASEVAKAVKDPLTTEDIPF